MRLRFFLLAVALLIAPAAFGGTYSVNDWCFYVNSLDVNRSCNNGSGVDNFNPSATSGIFDFIHLGDSGTLATAVITLPPGTYNIFAIFNYDITQDGGMNEFATVFGSLPIGQVYSVDTQDASESTPGNLYAQFAAGTLDNTNNLSGCGAGPCPDVSVALGYTNLVVPEGSNAEVSFLVNDTPPTSGFYVQQGDNNSPATINYSSNVAFTPENSFTPGGFSEADAIPNPEPGTVLMMVGGVGLMLLGLRRRKKA